MSTSRLRLRAAAERFGVEIAEILESSISQQNEWVDQARSPLGRRRHLALARKGDIPAQREGRLVLMRRADIDAYLEQRPVVPSVDETNEDEEAQLAELARRGGFATARKVR